MKIILTTLSLIFLILGNVNAQKPESIQILETLSSKINLKLSIVDSLYSFDELTIKNRVNQLLLNRKAKKELLKNCRKKEGLKLTFFSEVKLIPSIQVFEKLKNTDTTSWKYFETIKPFYLISNPLLFDRNNKAIIDIDLFGASGFTYILKKQNEKWIIEREFLRWIV